MRTTPLDFGAVLAAAFVIASTAPRPEAQQPATGAPTSAAAALQQPSETGQVGRGQLPTGQTEGAGVYDLDPRHRWNRVHRQFFVRSTSQGGPSNDEVLDPPLFSGTTSLFMAGRYAETLAVLDEFLNTNAHRLITDPLKRAVFQHDLWKVFDWVVAGHEPFAAERLAIASRLARVMRTVALTGSEIKDLPNNYAAAVASRAFASGYDPESRGVAFLPPDMLEANGSWVPIGAASRFGSVDPIAPLHADAFSESTFTLFWRLPRGRAATIEYLASLWDFPSAYIEAPPFPNSAAEIRTRRVALSGDLPALPYGTSVALVRRMLLIDAAGEVVDSSLVQNVQIRVFHEPTVVPQVGPPRMFFSGPRPDGQDFFEFTLVRRQLFAGLHGGLIVTVPGEQAAIAGRPPIAGKETVPPGSSSRDSFLRDHCGNCHVGFTNGGVPSLRASIRTATALLKPYAFFANSTRSGQLDGTQWKRRRADWGMLQALWPSDRR